jgi:hypothetical protein
MPVTAPPPVGVDVRPAAAPAAAAPPADASPSTAPTQHRWPTPPPCVPLVREGDTFILDINGDRQALIRARADG